MDEYLEHEDNQSFEYLVEPVPGVETSILGFKEKGVWYLEGIDYDKSTGQELAYEEFGGYPSKDRAKKLAREIVGGEPDSIGNYKDVADHVLPGDGY